MELSSSDKERIQHQYDALAKKTLVGEAKSHRRTLAKRAAREVTFSDLSESELAQLFTTDEYESDYFRFQVSGFDVLVKNELLAALNALPERKRDIILLSYFLDMSDAEIGELLNVVRTTVFRHRKSALAKIKQYLEGKAVYWSSFLVTLCSEIMLYIETPLVSYSYSLNEVSHSCTSCPLSAEQRSNAGGAFSRPCVPPPTRYFPVLPGQ